MNKIDFEDFVRDVTRYYGDERTISPERFSMWFNQVRTIPFAAIDFIKDSLFFEYKYLPKNLPRAMRKAYRTYAGQVDDEKQRSFKATPCRDCNGVGLFIPFVLDEKLLRYVKKVIACGSCENWKQHWDSLTMKIGRYKEMPITIQRMKKSDIERMQYFAGFDGQLGTAARIRELNANMEKMNRRN